MLSSFGVGPELVDHVVFPSRCHLYLGSLVLRWLNGPSHCWMVVYNLTAQGKAANLILSPSLYIEDGIYVVITPA
jgi:hypothetical protein